MKETLKQRVAGCPNGEVTLALLREARISKLPKDPRSNISRFLTVDQVEEARFDCANCKIHITLTTSDKEGKITGIKSIAQIGEAAGSNCPALVNHPSW